MTAVAALAGVLVLAFVSALVLASVATLVTLVATVFAAFAAFFGFFTGAFVGDTETLAMDTRRRFGFFTGAFVGDTKALAMDTRRTVLVETGAGSRAPRAVHAGKCQRASGTQHEKADCKQCRYP